MNEAGFVKAVHRRLAHDIYVWKIRDTLVGGVPDAYYSGEGGDLWVEYKYVPKLPVRATTTIKTCLTEQQKNWLARRALEGRAVALVIGSPEGCLILEITGCNTLLCVERMNRDDFIKSAATIDDVVAFIHTKCGGAEQNEQSTKRPRPRKAA